MYLWYWNGMYAHSRQKAAIHLHVLQPLQRLYFLNVVPSSACCSKTCATAMNQLL
jgi:hypothetical protein